MTVGCSVKLTKEYRWKELSNLLTFKKLLGSGLLQMTDFYQKCKSVLIPARERSTVLKFHVSKPLYCVGYLTPYLEVIQMADYRCEKSKTTFNLV